jgi:hypothetical protein
VAARVWRTSRHHRTRCNSQRSGRIRSSACWRPAASTHRCGAWIPLAITAESRRQMEARGALWLPVIARLREACQSRLRISA